MMYPVNHISISQGYHKGKSLDFGWWKEEYKGQDILSCDAGTVYKVEKQTSGGNVVFIKHNNGYVSCYGHLAKVSVKKGAKVSLGQKIGTMGATGKCTGQHLHFGIYKNTKNIYGNANIDPFKVCEVYPKQEVRQTGTTKNYLSKFKYHNEDNWTTGDYKLLVSKALRTSHKIGLNTVKVKNCDSFTKKYLTSTKPNDTAMLKVGTECKIREIYKENNGRVWGYWYKYWIVLCNVDGTPQAKKVG